MSSKPLDMNYQYPARKNHALGEGLEGHGLPLMPTSHFPKHIKWFTPRYIWQVAQPHWKSLASGSNHVSVEGTLLSMFVDQSQLFRGIVLGILSTGRPKSLDEASLRKCFYLFHHFCTTTGASRRTLPIKCAWQSFFYPKPDDVPVGHHNPLNTQEKKNDQIARWQLHGPWPLELLAAVRAHDGFRGLQPLMADHKWSEGMEHECAIQYIPY